MAEKLRIFMLFKFLNARLFSDRNDEAKERDLLRMERHKERARERNLARAAPDKR